MTTNISNYIKITNVLGQEIPTKFWKFPAGEVGVKIDTDSPEYAEQFHSFTIHVKDNYSSDIIMAVLMTASIIIQSGAEVFVHLPYFPYSRQDRACAKGEAASRSVLISMIENIGITTVYTDDLHSTSTSTKIASNPLSPKEVIEQFPNTETIVLPDQGAKNKYGNLFKNYNICYGVKRRNPDTGKIVSYELEGTPEGEITVVDDICDGGRTFIELSKIIKTTNKRNLFVTHGIFSNSIELIESHYDSVYFKNKVMHNV